MPSTDKYSTSEYDVSATGETSKDTRTTAMSDSSEGMMTHHHQQQQQVQVQEQTVLPPIALVSTCEEMNPARRCAFEDCAVYAAAGTWDAPDPNMAFLCICDGHGGRQMVEYLEDWLVFHVRVELGAPDDGEERMDNNTNNKDHPIDILQRLERAFLIADIHSKTFGVDTSGATVAVCLVTRTMNNTPDNGRGVWTIYAANAGDARIVLGHDGKAHQMTKDHRTDDPDEVRRIEENGGFLFKGRVLGVLAVTRSLGDHCMKEYVIAKPYTEQKTISKDPNDDSSFIILACDGLWDVMSDQDAVDFVLNYRNEKEVVAQYLVKEALTRGSTDNITVSVAWI